MEAQESTMKGQRHFEAHVAKKSGLNRLRICDRSEVKVDCWSRMQGRPETPVAPPKKPVRQAGLTVFPPLARLCPLHPKKQAGRSRQFMDLDQTIEVPLCDIQASYRQLRGSIDAAMSRVLTSGQVILGPEVLALE